MWLVYNVKMNKNSEWLLSFCSCREPNAEAATLTRDATHSDTALHRFGKATTDIKS